MKVKDFLGKCFIMEGDFIIDSCDTMETIFHGAIYEIPNEILEKDIHEWDCYLDGNILLRVL